MARTLHDHAIFAALGEFIRTHDYRRWVGIMGGHALSRTDAMYRQIVFLSKQLTEQGFFMLSGGGPGAMEATHLGASVRQWGLMVACTYHPELGRHRYWPPASDGGRTRSRCPCSSCQWP